MDVPFPALTHLDFTGPEAKRPKDLISLSSEFLGGSAPCLQHLHLEEISSLKSPTLLLSAPNLVFLELIHLPQRDIPPKEMVGALAVLTRLRILCIGFSTEIPPSHRQRRGRPIPTLLPALTKFEFVGDHEYLEDLVARIDTPRLDDVRIDYCEEVQTRQLSKFIGRSANLAQFRRAKLTIDSDEAYIELSLPRGECHQDSLSLTISDPESDVQLSCMTQVLGQLVPTLSSVGHLSICWQDQHRFIPTPDFASWEWLPFFRPFRAVEALHVAQVLAGSIGCALEGIDEEMVAEELPALHLLCLEDDRRIYYDRERAGSTERFLSLCQLSGRHVTIVDTEDEFEEALEESHL